MFKKKVRKTWFNATDSFTLEMLRAILTFTLQSHVYITQSMVKAQPPRPHVKDETPRRFAQNVLKIEVEGFFTSLDFPRRHGVGTSLPLLPSFQAVFVFTNDANGWYNWELWSAAVTFKDFYPPKTTASTLLLFDGLLKSRHSAPENLLELAKELQHRGPSRFNADE